MTDRGTVRIVVVVIGAIALALVVLVGILALAEKPVPSVLETLAGTTIGGLLAILVSTRNSSTAEPVPAAEWIPPPARPPWADAVEAVVVDDADPPRAK